MTDKKIIEMLNSEQVSMLRSIVDNGVESATDKELCLLYKFLDTVCEQAKQVGGKINPVTIQFTPIKNIFDRLGEDNQFISMR
jgi:hypothetical protein